MDSYETERRQWAEAARQAGGAEEARLMRYRRVLAAISPGAGAQRLLARISYLRVVNGGRPAADDDDKT